MSNLTEKMEALEAQLAAQALVTDALVDTVEPKLQAVLDQMDIIIVNNAANTKALLSAIGQSAACFPCPTPSIFPPVPSTEPIPLNTDACKRAQAFVAAVGSILGAFDTLQSFNVVGSFSVLNDAISQVVAGIAAGDTVPLPSFPETVNIVGNYISYAGERAFSGVSLLDQYDPHRAELVAALYSAGSPEAALSAWNTSMEGFGLSLAGGFLLEAVAYYALANYYFDPATLPDLSGFDGSLCAPPPGTCYTPDTQLITVTGGGSGSEYAVTGEFGSFIPSDTVNSTTGIVTFDLPSWFEGEFDGWTLEVLTGSAAIQWRVGDLTGAGAFSFTSVQTDVDGAVAFPSGAHTIHIFDAGPFTARLCLAEV